MKINDILSHNVTTIEYDDVFLLFNRKNLEIALVSPIIFCDEHNAEYNRLLACLQTVGMLKDSIFQTNNEDYYPASLSKMYLLLTTDCNIDCRYCTVKYNLQNHDTPFMSDGIISKSIDFLYSDEKFSNKHVTLYGGEPLLNKTGVQYFFNTIQKYNELRVDVITNGINVSNNDIKLFQENNPLVIVSLDGSKINHDRFRTDYNGSGTYDSVISGIERLRISNVRVGISLVLGSHNYQDIENICANLKDRFGIVSIGITLPHLLPNVCSDNNFLKFLETNYTNLLDICNRNNLWFEQGMKKVRSVALKQYIPYGCPVSNKSSMVRILPNGDITLCENLGLRGKYILGNVQHSSFKDVLQNSKEFYEWYHRTTNNFDHCISCDAQSFCGMGCPYDAFLQNGNINSVEERSCIINKQTIKWFLDKVYQTAWDGTYLFKIPSEEERIHTIVNCPW